MLINENRTKTLNNFVLKIEELKLKRKIKQTAETAKMKKKKLIESLAFVLVNVSQKNENLLDRKKIIEIFLTINVDVSHDVFNCTIDDKNNCMFIDWVMIRIDE